MILRKHYLILLLILLSSCSPYVNYLEHKTIKTSPLREVKHKNLYCNEKPEYNIIHNSSFTQKEFHKIINRLARVESYTITELGLLLYFYQMNVRPDATSQSSRIQIFAREKGELYYRDFLARNGKNLDNAIATLTQSGLIKKSLRSLLTAKKRSFPTKFTVQKEFNLYLDSQKSNLTFKEKYRDSLFRLGKPLQKGESYRSQIKIAPKRNGKTISSPPLFKLEQGHTQDSETFCNFDSKLYKKGIFLLNNEQSRSNIFGILRKNGDSIIFITRNAINSYKQSTSSLSGNATKSNVSLCFNKKKNSTLDLIGFNSRDPGQTLYHLFNYGIDNSQSVTDVIEYLIFPRHQFLTNPSRLIYESKRGTSDQLTYFLSFDFPVYHVENLAAVYALFQTKGKVTFIDDPRINTVQTCSQ